MLWIKIDVMEKILNIIVNYHEIHKINKIIQVILANNREMRKT